MTAADAGVLIADARCSTDTQDLTAQRHTLRQLGVSDDRAYLDLGMSGRDRSRPEGIAIARANGRLKGKGTEAQRAPAGPMRAVAFSVEG